MSQNYAQMTPRDRGGYPRDHMVPAMVAKVRTNKENAAVSSILVIGHNTTELEVAAPNQHVALKWLTQAIVDSSVAGTSVITATATGNWDHLVQKDTIRRFAIPISTFVQESTSVQGINRKLGLYPAVAYKTFAGNGSVLTGEF